jgi:hypothetical protein
VTLANQKTFAQIQQEISQEVLGLTIATSDTRPTLTLLKQYINDAYSEVCTSWDWSWLYRNDKTFNTVIGQTTAYAVDSAAGEVLSMRIPAKYQTLTFMPYADWVKGQPGGYTNLQNAIPRFYIPAPPASDGTLQFYLGPEPASEVMTVAYDYRLRVTALSADGDYPVVPSDWQNLIKLKALVMVYTLLGDGAVERMQNRQQQYMDLWQRAWMQDQSVSDGAHRYRDANAESVRPYAGYNPWGKWAS